MRQPGRLCHAPLVQDQRAPDINIIAEKCAFEGFTRFEDRFKMPLGISINYTSYAAKLLAEVRHPCNTCWINPPKRDCPQSPEPCWLTLTKRLLPCAIPCADVCARASP